MPTVHYLNVKNGDCSIIEHISDRITVIDVCKAFIPPETANMSFSESFYKSAARNAVPGNFDQKSDPDNPIEYLRKRSITSIFRFILTHPDMDHLDGFKDLFSEFSPQNFWDTANTKEIDDSSFSTRRRLGEDWKRYKDLRDSSPESDPKRLVYYSGDSNSYYKNDGLMILAPTSELMEIGNEYEDWNDASYVILYKTGDKKILFSGDSEDGTWAHILDTWKDAVSNVDVLIAPHHGRDSGRSYDFLDVLKPRLTLFGNASSDHLAYKPWSNRKLPILTNNQAGYIILDIVENRINVYVKNKTYAEASTAANDEETFYHERLDGWYLMTV